MTIFILTIILIVLLSYDNTTQSLLHDILIIILLLLCESMLHTLGYQTNIRYHFLLRSLFN